MAFRKTLWNAFTATIATTTPTAQEIQLACSDGVKLAAQLWSPVTDVLGGAGGVSSRTIVCLHGWMDNCRSFHQLGPVLGLEHTVVALDFPGHGRSSHKSIDAPPMVQAELAYYVAEAVNVLRNDGLVNDNKITLLGHSLGAGVASLYASCFPEQVDKLILLDGAGFLARDAKDTPLHVRRHIQRRLAVQQQKQTAKQSKGLPSLEAAIARRLQSIQLLPGNQTLSYATARVMVLRATHLDADLSQLRDKDSSRTIRFRHDRRYAWPSIQYMTQEQVEGIFRGLGNVDCCILLAEQGWPFREEHLEHALELIQPQMIHYLPGSHYFHADPETYSDVAKEIQRFLRREFLDRNEIP